MVPGKRAEICPAHRARALVSFALELLDRTRARYKRTRQSCTPPIVLMQIGGEKKHMLGESHLVKLYIYYKQHNKLTYIRNI